MPCSAQPTVTVCATILQRFNGMTFNIQELLSQLVEKHDWEAKSKSSRAVYEFCALSSKLVKFSIPLIINFRGNVIILEFVSTSPRSLQLFNFSYFQKVQLGKALLQEIMNVSSSRPIASYRGGDCFLIQNTESWK